LLHIFNVLKEIVGPIFKVYFGHIDAPIHSRNENI